ERLVGLEKLEAGPAFFEVASRLPRLRELGLQDTPPRDELDFSRFRALECLWVVAEEGYPLALESAGALSTLRELHVFGGALQSFSFTASQARLALCEMSGPVELRGDIVDLKLWDCEDLRWIPSEVLANLRRLSLRWSEYVRPEVL